MRVILGTLDVIYSLPSNTKHEVHEVMYLQSGKKIMRHKVKSCKIIQLVIERIEKLWQAGHALFKFLRQKIERFVFTIIDLPKGVVKYYQY